MKRIAILALALSAAVFAADCKDVNRTVTLRGNGSVEIETHKGSIRVSVWDRQEVEIQARIEAEQGSPMDRRRFERHRCAYRFVAGLGSDQDVLSGFQLVLFLRRFGQQPGSAIHHPDAKIGRAHHPRSSFRYRSYRASGRTQSDDPTRHGALAWARRRFAPRHPPRRCPGRVRDLHGEQQHHELPRNRGAIDAQEQPLRSSNELRPAWLD